MNLYIDTESTHCYIHRSESIIYKSQTTRSRWTRRCCRDLNARLRGGDIVYVRNNGYTTVQDRVIAKFSSEILTQTVHIRIQFIQNIK